MSEKEIFSQILSTLKEIKFTLQDFKVSYEAQQEFLMSKLSTIEVLSDNSREILESINENTQQ